MIRDGSISARAESSRARRAITATSWVYLRTCGVIRQRGQSRRGLRGLSPHVRSHHQRHPPGNHAAGSISARAESSSPPSLPTCSPWVYLRTCGVIVLVLGVDERTGGLSPHVRSHLLALACGLALCGSISARAESSGPIVKGYTTTWVYLRTCGVIHRVARADRLEGGLSPHVRSHRLRAWRPRAGWRSISARAESSLRHFGTGCMGWSTPHSPPGSPTALSQRDRPCQWAAPQRWPTL